MAEDREVVGLLHRADWTKLTLSGTVRGAEPVVDTVITVQSDEPPGGPWEREDEDAEPPLPPRFMFGHMPPWFFEQMREQAREGRRGRGSGPVWDFEPRGQDAACTLSVAPGRRFRADSADETWALGCDGERMWHWFGDRPAGTSVSFGFTGSDDKPRTPYQALLAPSWLLTGYSLQLGDEVTVAGRAGVRVRGTLRTVATRTTQIGGRVGGARASGLFAPIPRWMRATAYQGEVEAVVDAELGILLRCSQRSGDEPPRVTEFVSLDVNGPTDASAFTAPEGSVFGGDKGAPTRGAGERPASGPAGPLGDALGEALGTAGKEAAKAVAGLAAGGLGALIRYAPSKPRVDPFAQATAEEADPEAEIPADEPPPDEAAGEASAAQNAGLADEVLHLVYRNGLAVPPFSATLHEWFDRGAVLAAVPESARRTGFGGVGFLLDALRDSTRDTGADARHAVSNVRMGGWTVYRIDIVRSAAGPAFSNSGRDKKQAFAAANQPLTIASDGTRVWQVFPGRVITGPAAPPRGDLAALVDASWLLDRDLELSGGTEVWVGGRRAYRVVARYREPVPPGVGWWERLFFPAVAVVDAETGLVLRLTRFKGRRPATRQELRDFTALDAGADFGFTPPAGLPVIDAESRSGESEEGTWTWSWDPPH
ncbi:MAG TPA: hypothetical protein VH594_26765 [Trebonia sp.]|jgi:hypothetical protein